MSFTCVPIAPFLADWQQATPAYASADLTNDGESTIYLYRQDACDVLRLTDVADFYVWPDRIVCHPVEPARDHVLLEVVLLGRVLSVWLQRQGIHPLHASAVVVGGRAAAFLSHTGAGKSVLAATLVRAGYPLLTDDILPIEQHQGMFLGRPGYPYMRLWPDEAQHFLGHYEDLEPVLPGDSKRRVPVGLDGFGAFCDVTQPLACLYLPERHAPAEGRTQIAITPVSPREAVIELVRRSYAPEVLDTLGLRAQRLDFFAQMAQQIPMRRIIYPGGFEHLPAVQDAILADLKAL